MLPVALVYRTHVVAVAVDAAWALYAAGLYSLESQSYLRHPPVQADVSENL